MIKGKFSNSNEILEGIILVENIIKSPQLYKNHKLPFKHVRKSIYQTNHFSGEMISATGKDFKFSKNILKYDWNIKGTKLNKTLINNEPSNLPKINLRLSKLEHLKKLKLFIKKLGFNPIHSIEYGELLSNKDLSTNSYNNIIKTVKNFCKNYNLEFQLSTPKILIERDFDRVYEYAKSLILTEPQPNLVIINNIGFFWAFINDKDLQHIPIEIGQGINLLNSMSIKCLNQLHNIKSIDFTSFNDINNTIKTVKVLKNTIPIKKITIAGNIQIPSLGLCPLNNNSPVISRLNCSAPCKNESFALKDPSLNKIIPFACDGFCKMHMFDETILEDYKNIENYINNGLNEFVFDFSNLDAKFIPILLTKFLNTFARNKA